MFRKSISFVVWGLVIVATLTFGAAPVSALSCGAGYPVDLEDPSTSQTFAGVQTSTKIPFVYRYYNPGCLQSMVFTFVGGGGIDVQRMFATINNNGIRGDAEAIWVPKAMKYDLYIDVQYRSFNSEGGTSNRWKVINIINGAFRTMPAPSAPQNPRLSGIDRNLTVSWFAPGSNNTAVAKYIVKYPDGKVLCETANLDGCSIGELPDGNYVFIVAALNALGIGAEVSTNQLVVGPPTQPGFTKIARVAKGQKLELYWSAGTGTSAKARVFRVFDQNGEEVCGLPAPTSTTSVLSCIVTPAKSGTQYVLKVETNMGNAESGSAITFKPTTTKKSPKR
jgi:hypothetical protein